MNQDEGLPLTTCPVCGRDSPAGDFCGVCGAHIGGGGAGSAGRHSSYAAEPGEHLISLDVISTLFPHLPHRRTAPFRLALVAAGLVLLVFGILRLTGPSIAVAAVAVPFLYLLYLYEVEIYEDEPILVIGATFVLGLILGALWSYFTGPYVTRTLIENTAAGITARRDLIAAIVLPLIAQALMMVGPLVIYLMRRYDEALDGFTFGAMSALGFTLASTVVNLVPDLQFGLISSDSATQTTLTVLERGLLIPFINASLTGLLAGALWLQRGRVRSLASHGWTTSLLSAIAVAVIVRVGLGWLNISVTSAGMVAAVYFVAAVALLFAVRIALHHMLLAEAVDGWIGPEMPCVHCHRIVPRMAFCPHCGMATRATPKTGSGRMHRVYR